MENRFLEMNTYLRQCSGKNGHNKSAYASKAYAGIDGGGPAMASSQFSVWAQPFSAQDRVLVILIENGGVDLGIPTLVDKLLSSVPAASLIPDTYRQKLVNLIREKITDFTDNLLETVELSANRYSAAKPDLFGDVVILRAGTASYQDLKGKLLALSRAGKIVDLFILTHGSDKFIYVAGGIDDQKIRAMKAENGKPLSIRSVYMMNCVGSSLNQAWIDAGAKVSSGALRNNYLPEPTMFFFWKNWQEGQNFENAVTSAYRKTINLMNDGIRTFLRQLPIPSADSLAVHLDFENLDFVKDSAPVIQGQRSITINTDDLSFSQSTSSSLATTVLPVRLLDSLGVSQSAPDAQKRSRVISQQGIDFIKGWESFRATMYNDPVGHCTIGYGTLLHTGNCDGRPSEQTYVNGISEENATQLLRQKADEFQQIINDSVTVELNQNQNDSLVSFVYNVGGNNFQKSTLLRLLNQGNYSAVPTEMKKRCGGRTIPETVVGDGAESV
jgi:GH24 family phage-related lysozyme (muramidase)